MMDLKDKSEKDEGAQSILIRILMNNVLFQN